MCGCVRELWYVVVYVVITTMRICWPLLIVTTIFIGKLPATKGMSNNRGSWANEYDHVSEVLQLLTIS